MNCSISKTNKDITIEIDKFHSEKNPVKVQKTTTGTPYKTVSYELSDDQGVQVMDIAEQREGMPVFRTQRRTEGNKAVSYTHLDVYKRQPYVRALSEVLYHLQDEIDTSNSPLMQTHGGADLVLLVNTDRGLCGGLNANLIKLTREHAPENAHYITIGRKLNAALAK